LPSDSIHADFAAVNVNFWITPESANEDIASGGLIVYAQLAPPEWGFLTYNRRTDLIRAFLRERGSKAVTIGYRQNRAVIIDSNLLHATAPMKFRAGYENRRINITALFGDRTHPE
jgi:hypothetical protein